MPVKRPPAGRLVHRRHNGRFFLEIAAHPDYGLPYGQDRLVLIWVATLAIRQQSRIVRFNSAARMFEEFDLPLDGPHYRRMMEGFRRIFTSTIFFGAADGQPDTIESARVHFFDSLDLWFSRVDPRAEQENVVTLSDAFWCELRQHPIPIQRDAVRAFAASPGCLDLYLWLRWRTFRLHTTHVVPLIGRQGLADQLGFDEYARERDLRRMLDRWLSRIRLVWPECPCRLSGIGLALVPSRIPQRPVD